MDRITDALAKFLRVVIDDMENGAYKVTPVSAMAILDAVTGQYGHDADTDEQRLAESFERAYGYLCQRDEEIKRTTIHS